MNNEEMAVDYEKLDAFARETNDKLRQAWEEGNEGAYATSYQEFAKFLELPFVTNETHPDKSFELISATNGAQLGHRHRTTKEEDAAVLKRARESAALFSKLPIEFRQAMLADFMQNHFSKVAFAAALAQTANMGKSIKESSEEVAGKGAAWFKFAASKEVREFIQTYAQKGIKTGWEASTAEGVPLLTKAQLDDYKGANIIMTKYPDKTNINIDPNVQVGGGLVAGEQITENYLALAFPGIAIPAVVGNANITKLRATTPDAFEIVRMAFLHFSEKYMRDHAQEVRTSEIDLTRDATIRTVIDGLSQSVTSRGLEKVVDCFRVVGSMETGASLHENRESSELSDLAKSRSTYELAGENVIYIHQDISDDDLAIIVKQLAGRIVSNQGMTCTRANAIMVHESRYGKFVELWEKAMEQHDLSAEKTIANPHDPEVSQGSMSNGEIFRHFQESLDEDRRLGARVNGGRRLHEGKGSNQSTIGYSVWPERFVKNFEVLRVRGKEVFGPKTNILPVKGLEDAVRITNLSGSSLSSALYTYEERVIEGFVNGTNLGSYNIWNPKGSSDNSPVGGHIAQYKNAKFMTQGGQERELTILNNFPTGSFGHVAQQLNVPGVPPEKSVWVSRAQAEKAMQSVGIKLE